MYPQVFGKYVLERELARGGMARVLLATLRGAGGFEKKLVVKQIRDELAYDQQFVRRFVEEAKTTVALSHPNIVVVYELGVEQGTYFIAMELVEGVSLADLLAQRNAAGERLVLTPEEGAYVGVELCRALDYAHRRMNVVHRDITPRNVMIDEEGQIKLIDFGIAAPALVAGQEILGSPGHMAPEQVDGGELGPPTDIFAVAVLLMEVWTGTAPFRRATPEECAAAVREPHPKPSDFDPRLLPLDAAIGRAMSVDPRERQQEASSLARALRSFLKGNDVADISRALGDRVRDLRAEAAAEEKPKHSLRPRASVVSQSDLGTRTFAAREEALSWSSPPPAPTPTDLDGGLIVPSTRRLQDSTPKLPAALSRVDEDPALSVPTPLALDMGELERAQEQAALSASDGRPERHVEDGASAAASRASPTARRRYAGSREPPEHADGRPEPGAIARHGRALAMFGGGALVAATVLVVWSARGGPLHSASPPTSSAGTTPQASSRASTATNEIASASVQVTRSSATPTCSEATVAAAPPAPASAPPASASSSLLGSANAPSVASGKASVTLLGEPGTRVWIDGVSRGPCPVRVTLAEGPHEVRFIFDPTGESRGERFTVKSGDRVTVRAEFTGATPTVRIQR
ncbi:MAG TPA: serine/threonine-protein kinase [Labilithrix sp.]|nr:serine/threonine-protein kinase [Labilithrix sp.]